MGVFLWARYPCTVGRLSLSATFKQGMRYEGARWGEQYMGTSLIRKRITPKDPPRTLGIGLGKGLRGVRFFASEVPMYAGICVR